ncbi:MAG: HIT family protein [Chlamydiota bacterium]
MRSAIALLLLLAALIEGNACPFCRESVITLQTVYETEHFRVLIDFEPRVPGHLLAVTKRHIAMIDEMTQEEWTDLHQVVPRIANAFAQLLDTDQYVVLEKNGKKAFQDISHVHIHFFPIHDEKWGDVFDIIPRRLTPEEIDAEVSAFKEHFLCTG